MRSFKDSAGRSWDVSISVQSVKTVRDLLKIDLYALVEQGAKGLGDLLGNPVAFVDVLYVLCREQAQKQGVSDEDFGRGFAGDVLELAGDCFVEELIDFFPNRPGRASLRKLIAKGKEAGAQLMSRIDSQIEALSPERMAELLDKHLSGSSGNAPAA